MNKSDASKPASYARWAEKMAADRGATPTLYSSTGVGTMLVVGDVTGKATVERRKQETNRLLCL